MTTSIEPLIDKFHTVISRCKQKWHDWQAKIHRLLSPADELTLAPLEELELPQKPQETTLAAAHWPLDEHSGKIEQHNMVIVEVKYYQEDPYKTGTEVEDPYSRITHYPPSNRLH